MSDAKRCNRCGYLQIIEGFPLHRDSKTKGRPLRRSCWCLECWREYRLRDTRKRHDTGKLGAA